MSQNHRPTNLQNKASSSALPRFAPGLRGFTLLEILIALSLTAMLLAMLTAGVYGVIRDWDDNAEGLEKTLDQTVATLQLERALQGAFPHSFRDTETLGRYVYFDGENNRLSWVSSVSPQRNPGLTAWRIYSESDGRVMLQLAPAFSDYPDERLSTAEPIVLLEGYELEIRYLYEDLDFQRRWRDEWSGRDLQSLPEAVHVKLIPSDRSDQSQQAPIEIIAPIASTQHRSIEPTQEFLN